MKLVELISQIKEPTLSRTQLEDLNISMTNLYGLCRLEMADLQKKEALFMDSCPEKTKAAKELKWGVTKEGQRLIELKNYNAIIEKHLASLRSRIYNLI